MTQQSETRKYFGIEAERWDAQAKKNRYNTITDRNNAVLDSLRRHGKVKNFLDVGCGTGQLTIEIAGLGVDAVGIDFAPGMIDVSLKNTKDANSTAKFSCASVFDISLTENSFDLISAQGFIEYISESELTNFIEILSRILKKNGHAVIGSRNRLFNIASMNEYTQLEVEMGAVPDLIAEAIAVQMSPSQQSLFQTLSHFTSELDRPTSHPNTGIDVATRYQYTPSELIAKFHKVGLTPNQIYPINFHPMPQSLLTNERLLQTKDQLSNIVASDYPTTHQFVPYSSSFVLSFTKP
jgi:2-polyprenyl-3-methyl-5-hydroxy-6-metoxy-1,4-benzoquinol methylase